MNHSSRRLRAIGLIALVGLAACGGGDDAASDDASTVTTAADLGTAETTPATEPMMVDTTMAAAADTTVADAMAATTVAETVGTAVFDGPVFVDVIDGALAPYTAAIGTTAVSAELSAALPAMTADVPVSAGVVVSGVMRSYEQVDETTVDDEQVAASDTAVVLADLEAFGAAVPAGWTQKSFSTSGSIGTLLLTSDVDGRRAAYTIDGDAPAGSRPAWELSVTPTASTMGAPAWLAALPSMEGGQLVEVVEGAGRTSLTGVPTTGYVSVRYRYPAESLPALEEYLASGVVESAGFTYDRDSFNGFAAMVDVTAGDWAGTVLLGEGSMNDETFIDLIWSLTRP